MKILTRGVPDWDLEQLEVIMEEPASWQLVVAGPGTGKTAVACQRVASLVDDGVAPSRILLVSFTRTAVAELRDRIVSYAVAGDLARIARISTIDSHAWSLRAGFDEGALPRALGDESYDLNIERAVELFQERQPDLIDFMKGLEHLIIDEAQDVMGLRAELIIQMLTVLNSECGVTILADPAQAIYGFTTDDDESQDRAVSLLELLESRCPRRLTLRQLGRIYRIQTKDLVEVFTRTRKAAEDTRDPVDHVGRVQSTIKDACANDVGDASYEDITDFLARSGNESTLVLFRRRAEALIASSYCSRNGIEHRLRISGTPLVAMPWVGWLFGEVSNPIISRLDFENIWEHQVARIPAPFDGVDVDSCWTILHRLAAGRNTGTLDLVRLRHALNRSRPPVELCLHECGTTGPIIGTIHASKGREAETVLLVMPPGHHYGHGEQDTAATFEEGRVYYVGATRAQKMLVVAANTTTPVGYLDSRRVFRRMGTNRVQLEIGRAGDVDRLAHLCWSSTLEVQEALASCAGRTVPVHAICLYEQKYAWRLELEYQIGEHVTRDLEIGEMSRSFREELGELWRKIDSDGNLKPPPKIPHLYILGVTTVGLSEDEMSAVRHPFNQSGIALAPVVKGFPTIPFFYRHHKGYTR